MVSLTATRTGLIGVDLGAHSVKLAQIERRGGVWRLIDAVTVPRREAWPSQLGPHTALSSVEEIRTAVEIGRFRGAAAACLAPRQVTEVRTLQVPPGTAIEQRQMLSGEVQAWDEARGRAEFDFLPAPVGAGSRNAVLVASLSEAWSSQIQRDMRAAGLRCRLIDAAPAAACRAAAALHTTPQEAVPQDATPLAVLDWGFHEVSLSVCVGGAPAFHRSLPGCGLAEVRERIRRFRPDVELTEALGPTAPHPSLLVKDASSAVLRRLRTQVERTLEYLGSRRRRLVPDRCLVCGGGAAAPVLAHDLDSALPLKVDRLDAAHLGLGEPADHRRQAAIDVSALAFAISLSHLAWA